MQSDNHRMIPISHGAIFTRELFKIMHSKTALVFLVGVIVIAEPFGPIAVSKSVKYCTLQEKRLLRIQIRIAPKFLTFPFYNIRPVFSSLFYIQRLRLGLHFLAVQNKLNKKLKLHVV